MHLEDAHKIICSLKSRKQVTNEKFIKSSFHDIIGEEHFGCVQQKVVNIVYEKKISTALGWPISNLLFLHVVIIR
jgi:hypothetical protein